MYVFVICRRFGKGFQKTRTTKMEGVHTSIWLYDFAQGIEPTEALVFHGSHTLRWHNIFARNRPATR